MLSGGGSRAREVREQVPEGDEGAAQDEQLQLVPGAGVGAGLAARAPAGLAARHRRRAARPLRAHRLLALLQRLPHRARGDAAALHTLHVTHSILTYTSFDYSFTAHSPLTRCTLHTNFSFFALIPIVIPCTYLVSALELQARFIQSPLLFNTPQGGRRSERY